jgi:hypothetical protein
MSAWAICRKTILRSLQARKIDLKSGIDAQQNEPTEKSFQSRQISD